MTKIDMMADNKPPAIPSPIISFKKISHKQRQGITDNCDADNKRREIQALWRPNTIIELLQ
jgi:hypothetical protein